MEIIILLVWALWELLIMATELAVAIFSAAAWLSSAALLLFAWMSIRRAAQRLGIGVGSAHRAARAFQKTLSKTDSKPPLGGRTK
jgi:hypothetical protein